MVPASLQGPDKRSEFTDFEDYGENDRRNDAYKNRGQGTVSAERRYDLRGKELDKKIGGTSYDPRENQGQPRRYPNMRFCHLQGTNSQYIGLDDFS
jgi:hypothetical protein